MKKLIRDFFNKSGDNAANKYDNMTAEEVFDCGMEMMGKQPINEVKQTFVIAEQKGHPFAKDMLIALDVSEEGRDKAILILYGAIEQNPESVFGMGTAYELGSSGYPQSYEDAVRWYRMAADMGHPKAQCNLGWCYMGGHGVEVDEKEARKWYLKAASNGDMMACANLYDMYWREEDYDNCRRQAAHVLFAYDDEEALEGLEQVQEAHIQIRTELCGDRMKALEFENSIGNLEAKCYLASTYYEYGMYEKAFPLLVECVDAKDRVTYFVYLLGECYLYGRGTKVDKEAGIRILCKAAYDYDEHARNLLKELDIDWEDYDNDWVDYNYGWEDNDDDCVDNDDDAADCMDEDECEAMCQQTRAEGNGDGSAEYEIGLSLLSGDGGIQYFAEAVTWLRMAAEKGHADAQYELAVCYRQGEGGIQDFFEAVKWDRQAAVQGHKEAMYALGRSYYLGLGVRKSEALAIKWFQRAAEEGDEDAILVLKQLAK